MYAASTSLSMNVTVVNGFGSPTTRTAYAAANETAYCAATMAVWPNELRRCNPTIATETVCTTMAGATPQHSRMAKEKQTLGQVMIGAPRRSIATNDWAATASARPVISQQAGLAAAVWSCPGWNATMATAISVMTAT